MIQIVVIGLHILISFLDRQVLVIVGDLSLDDTLSEVVVSFTIGQEV